MPTSAGGHDEFNGDGYADVAFAAPSATVDGKAQAGYVAVMYGSATGLRTASRQVFHQNTPGLPGVAETGDAFGAATALSDTDRDGRADPVVGATGENARACSVWVLPGSTAGATAKGSFTFGAGTLGTVAAGAELGRSFNH